MERLRYSIDFDVGLNGSRLCCWRWSCSCSNRQDLWSHCHCSCKIFAGSMDINSLFLVEIRFNLFFSFSARGTEKIQLLKSMRVDHVVDHESSQLGSSDSGDLLRQRRSNRDSR